MSLTDELDKARRDSRGQMPGHITDVLEQGIEDMSRSGIAERSLKVGDQAPNFELPDTHGSPVPLQDLLASGPVVLSFFRGGWCPFCSLELDSLQRVLPSINELGASLVAVSPQTEDSSMKTAQDHGLTFNVLSDIGNAVARQFGIVYHLQDEMQAIYDEFDLELKDYNGDDSFDLPVPATYVIDSQRTIRAAFVDPDYTRRLDPVEILSTLRGLRDTKE
jgi:peroxiredoxin